MRAIDPHRQRFVSSWLPIDSERNGDVVMTNDGGGMPPTPVGSMCCPIVPHQVTFCKDDAIEYIEPSKEFNNHLYSIMWDDDGSGWHAL